MKPTSSRDTPSSPKDKAQILNISFTKVRNHIEVIYIKVREGVGHHSIEADEQGDIVLNLDRDNNLIGIELLTPIPVGAAQELVKISRQYNAPELESFNPQKLEEAFA